VRQPLAARLCIHESDEVRARAAATSFRMPGASRGTRNMTNHELSDGELDMVAGGADDKVTLECKDVGTNDKGERLLLCTEKKTPKKEPKAPIFE
jgi:hypothetical protein